jgi:hypothetical protein
MLHELTGRSLSSLEAPTSIARTPVQCLLDLVGPYCLPLPFFLHTTPRIDNLIFISTQDIDSTKKSTEILAIHIDA